MTRPHADRGATISEAAGKSHPRMVDALGDTLAAGRYPARIVSLSPSLTEILFAIGVDSTKIVGVTRYCDYPPAARRRPVVGGIVDPSLEMIEARRPDLVLAVRGNPVNILQRIRSLGFPVFAFDDRGGLNGVLEIMEKVVTLVGADDSAAGVRVVDGFRSELNAYRAWSDSLRSSSRRIPRVYYADPEHLSWTAGPGGHIDDLIRLAGGENIVRDGGAWPQFSQEQLVIENPDWLLLALPSRAKKADVLAEIGRAPGWSGLPALRDGRICWIASEVLLRPGPRILRALETLAGCLHPEARKPTLPMAEDHRMDGKRP